MEDEATRVKHKQRSRCQTKDSSQWESHIPGTLKDLLDVDEPTDKHKCDIANGVETCKSTLLVLDRMTQVSCFKAAVPTLDDKALRGEDVKCTFFQTALLSFQSRSARTP